MENLYEPVLCDAHTHLETAEEWEERKQKGIISMVCGSTPEEAERILSKLYGETGETGFLPTFGLHPWHAADYEVSDMSRYFSKCPVIGEIGMDSVWCQVPLDTQERVFRQQLALALGMKKPVILHTKGEEERIARILREYPNKYLLHWYSCGEYLEEYLKLDCYFSIGPDVWWNPAVRRIARKVPLDRLLLETDGMSAVRWAYEEAPSCPIGGQRRMAPKSASAALIGTLEETAKLRNLFPEELSRQVYENLTTGFLERGGISFE